MFLQSGKAERNTFYMLMQCLQPYKHRINSHPCYISSVTYQHLKGILTLGWANSPHFYFLVIHPDLSSGVTCIPPIARLLCTLFAQISELKLLEKLSNSVIWLGKKSALLWKDIKPTRTITLNGLLSSSSSFKFFFIYLVIYFLMEAKPPVISPTPLLIRNDCRDYPHLEPPFAASTSALLVCLENNWLALCIINLISTVHNQTD